MSLTRFYSLCGKHHPSRRRPDCPACNTGITRFVWTVWISHYFYRHHRRLWLWWVNRPNSKAKRELRSFFPNLRGAASVSSPQPGDEQ